MFRARRLTSIYLLHQGGWDEILMIFGLPTVLFVVFRYLAARRERREAKPNGRPPESD